MEGFRALLKVPDTINSLNGTLLQKTEYLDDPQVLLTHLRTQVERHEQVTFVGIGFEESGDYYAVDRMGKDGTIRFAVCNDKTERPRPPTFHYWKSTLLKGWFFQNLPVQKLGSAYDGGPCSGA